MNSADDVKRLFKDAELNINSDTHEQVFRDVLSARQQATKGSPAKPDTWRFIMRNPITKYAFAAVIVVAAIAVFNIFNKTGSVTWAIEQSIEALEQYGAVIVEGTQSQSTWTEDGGPEHRLFKLWAVANDNQTMVEKYRTEVEGFLILTTNGQKTWRYDPNTNTVHIENRPYVASECWCGSQFLEQLKDFRDTGILTKWEITYGKDPATGRQRIFLTIAWLEGRYNGPRSLWLEFDRESKLLVSLKQWENADCEGPADMVVEKIAYFEILPDDLFEFEIPEGATVIECQ